METRQLHLLLKHDSHGSPVMESLTSPTSEAKIFIQGNKALVVLIDFNRGVSVTNGACALARYIEKPLSQRRVRIESIGWVFRDTDLQWDRFERLGQAVQFSPLEDDSSWTFLITPGNSWHSVRVCKLNCSISLEHLSHIGPAGSLCISERTRQRGVGFTQRRRIVSVSERERLLPAPASASASKLPRRNH